MRQKSKRKISKENYGSSKKKRNRKREIEVKCTYRVLGMRNLKKDFGKY